MTLTCSRYLKLAHIFVQHTFVRRVTFTFFVITEKISGIKGSNMVWVKLMVSFTNIIAVGNI